MLRTMVVGVILFGLASIGHAACWGPGQRTAEISRSEYQLKAADGTPRRVVLIYEVNMRGEVCERGDFQLSDQRVCVALPYERRFARTVQVFAADGTKTEPATRIQRVATAPELQRKGPCTDHASELTNAFFAAQTGTADKDWAAPIRDDLPILRRDLALIGLVLPGA